MAKVKIGLDQRKSNEKKDGTFPLVMKVHHKQSTHRISLKISVKPHSWDEQRLRLKSGNDSKKKNAQLHIYLKRANSFLINNLYEVEQMNPLELKKRITVEIFSLESDTKFKKEQRVARQLNGNCLTTFAERKIERLRIAHKNGNADVIRQSLNRIYAFSNRKQLNFADIDLVFLKDFQAFCLSRGNKPNTISIYLRPIKALYREAVAEGLIPQVLNPFDGGRFKIPKSKTKNRALSREDIQSLRELKLVVGSAQWNARAYFLFMFNCRGMNFIDLVKLKKSQLKDVQLDKEGDIIQAKLTYNRTKLGEQKTMNMRLSKEALEILNHFISNSSEFVFPMGYTESKTGRETYKQQRKRINRKLKELGKLAGIDPDISTYYARHTWATLASRSNLPINMIREGLGHSDISTTQIYIDSFGDDELDDANDRIVA